jgi:purine-binding chemotaxis protein CheW
MTTAVQSEVTTKSDTHRSVRRSGKYLAFLLANEEYAIPVLQVREIMGVQHITAVPQTPNAVKGVINLRGKVIPVIDLRVKFGLDETAYTQRTCIVVVQLSGGITGQMGVVVDEVCEVLTLADADIEDTPVFGNGISVPYVIGMAKVKGKVKILLDIDEALTNQDSAALAEVLTEAVAQAAS